MSTQRPLHDSYNPLDQKPKKKKSHTKQSRKIRDRDTGVNYSGERSAYWDFIESSCLTPNDGRLREPAVANPDTLSEEQSLFHQPPTEEAEFRLGVIREAMRALTPLQKDILRLCGMENYSLRDAARQLGVRPSTVQTVLGRVREKIRREYERRKLLEQ